jgi:hypothetical protein
MDATVKESLTVQKDIETIWCAWHEMNAIRAKDGAPDGICENYWSQVVENLKNMLPEKYQNPWHPKYVRQRDENETVE